MRRRSGATAPLSLFSFQDIITSVTAILILIVLILTLEWVARQQQAAASTPELPSRDLRAAVAELEDLVTRLTARLPADAGLVPAVAAAEVARDLRIVRDQVRRAVAATESARAIEGRAAELLARARNALAVQEAACGDVEGLAETAVEVEREAEGLAQENRRQRTRLAEKERELAKRPAPGTELVFNAPPDGGRQPWLVEVSAAGCNVVRLGSNTRVDLGTETDAESRLGDWTRSLRPDRDYVLLLVRPSGVKGYAAARSLLAERGIGVGVDFVGEDQDVRDGLAEGRAAAEDGEP